MEHDRNAGRPLRAQLLELEEDTEVCVGSAGTGIGVDPGASVFDVIVVRRTDPDVVPDAVDLLASGHLTGDAGIRYLERLVIARRGFLQRKRRAIDARQLVVRGRRLGHPELAGSHPLPISVSAQL